jgi:CRP/FNR family cyclic AMP-dependent transcriptional regulator
MYLHPLLASVPLNERTDFVQHIKLHSYRQKAVILMANEWTDRIYCVANGLLRIVVQGSGGSADVTTEFIAQDELFLGPHLSEHGYQSEARLVTVLPSSVYHVPISELLKLCSRYPGVTMGLLELELKRTKKFRKQVRRILSAQSERLISRILHDLTEIAPVGTGSYDKRISQEVIASYAGRTRVQVNRTMRDLESRGLVKKDEHSVQVPPSFACSDFQELRPSEESRSKVEQRPADASFFSALFENLERSDRLSKQ